MLLLNSFFHADRGDNKFEVFKDFRLLALDEALDCGIGQQLGQVSDWYGPQCAVRFIDFLDMEAILFCKAIRAISVIKSSFDCKYI